MIQDTARQFSRDNLLPNALEWDQKSYFPKETIKSAADLGFGGIYVGEEFGGSGLGYFESSIIISELSYGCVSSAAYISIHNMVNGLIYKFGSDTVKKEFCPQLSSMDLMASYCLTEPNSGSDAGSLKTSYKIDGNDFVINGSKCFISGSTVSDIYLVMCKGEKGISSILVPKDTIGLSFGKLEKKMGWKSSPTATVTFDNVRVPIRNLVGTEGDGFKYAMESLNGGRINIGSCSIGAAEFVFDKTKDYVNQRVQFNKKISEFQNTQFKLSEMLEKIVSSKLLVLMAAKSLDQSLPSKILLSSMAKMSATEKCYEAVDMGLQMFGGYGYFQDYEVERVLRDLRVNRILEGTNEIMRLIIHKEIQKIDQQNYNESFIEVQRRQQGYLRVHFI